ncbi:MAG: ferredoxin family protein [Gemmataceae bacterium]|nr:ferredoxin family protein [Gemmataceae bacterium]
MTRHRLTVVLSQAQGKNPAKRALEEALVAALIMEPGLDVATVPHLYDLPADHTARLFLEGARGDLVVIGWMYPRAAFWLLDRDGIKGRFVESQLKPPADEDEADGEEPEPPRGIGAVGAPDRHIYCLDLRTVSSPEPYLEEVRRIAAECRARREAKEQEKARANPVMVALGASLSGNGNGTAEKALAAEPQFTPEQLLQTPGRRWYPVIDYSRCTNCMECLDFCLFGVYGVDRLDRIAVENQDSCKRGCPACSRVCPEQAIMFPDYKTPAIAGAPVGAVGGLKIDLTRLFVGDVKDALEQAALERDRELVADGRAAVGTTVGMPKRQADKPQQPKDDLDNLMDALDDLDL